MEHPTLWGLGGVGWACSIVAWALLVGAPRPWRRGSRLYAVVDWTLLILAPLALVTYGVGLVMAGRR